MSDPRLALLARSVDRCFRGPAWHGPTLTSSIRGIPLELASFRPQPKRHNAWELIVHAAYWKYRVCAVLVDLPRGSFDLEGSNFFERNVEMGRETWDADLDLLAKWHERLLDAVRTFDADRLEESIGGGRFTYEALIDGAGAHDVYHAGQIQLLKKLWKDDGP